jgi:hypothetical protein
VTLPAFQRALCELIASPELCLAVRAGGSGFFSCYDLSPRERDRLHDIVWQPGMATSCTLYRSNRVTPVYTLLHYTCVVLGDRLKETLDAYWAATELLDLQFKNEIERFARFLRDRIARGALTDEYVEEVLDFELAVNELRFAPRRAILAGIRAGRGTRTPTAQDPHELTRIVRFRHDPSAVLNALAEGRVPKGIREEDTRLLLSVAGGELSVHALSPTADPAVAARLNAQT